MFVYGCERVRMWWIDPRLGDGHRVLFAQHGDDEEALGGDARFHLGHVVDVRLRHRVHNPVQTQGCRTFAPR